MLLLLLSFTPGFGDSAAEKVLGERLLSDLISKGELTRTFWEGGSVTLIPDLDITHKIEDEITRLNPNISVEVLTIYESSNLNLETEEALLTIYNILLSVGTMEGIEYYSASRERMRILFSESYCIDSPESQIRVHDPVVDSIPPYAKIYTFQKDLTFGQNIYQSEYRFSGEYILMKSRNLTTMRYLFLPLVKPNNSVNYFILIPSGNRLVFYGVSCLRTLSFLGLEKKRAASLYNRNNAIYNWFITRLES